LIEDPRALALLLEAEGVKPAKDFRGEYCKDGELKAIPRATKYRLLKRLAELGYLETVEGVDKRYRFYKLTKEGALYKKYVVQQALKYLKQVGEVFFGEVRVPLSKFKAISCKLGLPPKVLLDALGARVERGIITPERYVTIKMDCSECSEYNNWVRS